MTMEQLREKACCVVRATGLDSLWQLLFPKGPDPNRPETAPLPHHERRETPPIESSTKHHGQQTMSHSKRNEQAIRNRIESLDRNPSEQDLYGDVDRRELSSMSVRDSDGEPTKTVFYDADVYEPGNTNAGDGEHYLVVADSDIVTVGEQA